MAIYLGTNEVNFVSGKKSRLDEIIKDTISGAFENSEVTRIKAGAFAYCSQLTSINFPKCTIVGSSAFAACKTLESINLPNCTTVNEGAFAQCSALTTVNLSKCTVLGLDIGYFGTSPFSGCSALTAVYAPICSSIFASTFSKCYNLISLYLTSVSSVTTLGFNAFSSTPIGGYSTSAGRYGSVFVPASLYSSFLTATNWSNISDRIVSV